MTRVAIVPIDNRPICYDLIQDILAQDNELELFLPDITILGGLYNSSDTDKIFDFIKKLSNIDYFIISLDTIAYGGLITSRRCDDDINVIKDRIKKLKKLIPKKTKILAFSSIMRISNNNINEEEKEYWSQYGKKIFDWSYKSHKSGYELKSDIPKEILEDYLNTRKRNFEINKLYLKMAHDGFFDTLVFSKDDCAEFGLNVKEAHALEYLIKRDNIQNVFIKTGADEIPLTLLCRALAKNQDIKINPIFLNPESVNLISKYEDVSIFDCIHAQINLAGIAVSSKPDLVFVINNFTKEQGDLVLGDVVNNTTSKIDFPQKPYFIADVNNANGADCGFIEQLLKQKTDNFYGYCGYNTSANSIGCAILSAVVKYLAVQKDSYNDNAFKRLQYIRLLDDWSYQAKYRKEVRESAPEFLEALSRIKSKLDNDGKIITDYLNYYPSGVEYSLPWNRSFEIRIKLK